MSPRFLLDTDSISDLLRNPRGRVAARSSQVSETRVCTSIIVAAELRYGAAKTASPRLFERLRTVLGTLDVLAVESRHPTSFVGS